MRHLTLYALRIRSMDTTCWGLCLLRGAAPSRCDADPRAVMMMMMMMSLRCKGTSLCTCMNVEMSSPEATQQRNEAPQPCGRDGRSGRAVAKIKAPAAWRYPFSDWTLHASALSFELGSLTPLLGGRMRGVPLIVSPSPSLLCVLCIVSALCALGRCARCVRVCPLRPRISTIAFARYLPPHLYYDARASAPLLSWPLLPHTLA